MAHNISVDVKNKIATGDGTIIVCGNSDYVVNFTFDSEWANFTTKTMRVVYNGGYQEVVFNGNSCAFPIISDTLGVKIGVYAGNLETSTPAYFDCVKSIICGSGTHVTPPTDVYNQIIAMLNGFSADVEKTGGTATITIVDPHGTTVATVSDGAKGETGDCNFATFEINPTTGILSATYTKENSEITFSLNQNGYIEVEI